MAASPVDNGFPKTMYVIVPAGLNLRQAPSTSAPVLQKLQYGTQIQVEAGASDIFVQISAPASGWVAQGSGSKVYISATKPLGWTLPFTAAQRGVGASAGGWALETQHCLIIQKSQIEVVLICCYEPNQAAKTIPALRGVGVNTFILRAATHEKPTTPGRYVDLTLPILKEYAAQLGNANPLMIAIHNEPNLTAEGWGSAWADGAGFASWWQAVAASYRTALPNAKLGFPALSPGGDAPGVRLNESAFIMAATPAIQTADWIGVHYYWAKPDGSDINPPFAQWKSWFGTRPIIATEVGPTDNNTVTADAVRKAYQVFSVNNVPAMAWLLTGAGAWHNAAWDEHGIML